MGLFDIFKREKRSEPIGAVTLEELLGGGNKLTVDIAMQVPAVAYCVEMIAGAAAMLPVKLYVKKPDGEIEEITDDRRVKFLNSDTGDTINADNMRRVWVRDFLLTGSAFGYIESYFGQPSAIKYIPSYAVSVMIKDIDYINKHFTYNVNGGEIFPYRMLKILRNSDGFGKGRGIVQESPLIVETMYQLLKFQKNQVLKGGNKRGFLQSKGVISKDSEENLKRNWANIYSDDMNVNKVMFLNGDVDFKEMSSTSVEMQLNENVKTNDAEIMRLFGTVDGILSPDTVKNAVMPVLDAFEAAFDSDLLLESEKADHYFAFDTKELTRGSVSERYSAYATALQNNFMQLDEVRALEDLPPLGFNYITLGLQNVLVNPSTGEVYTPNTNAVANMNRLGNVSGTDNDGAEERAKKNRGINKKKTNYKQNPTTGLMEGSESTADAKGIPEKESEMPTDSSEKTIDKKPKKKYNKDDGISALGENKFEQGFSQKNLDKHWGGSRDHSKQYPDFTKDQYAQRALDLVQSAADGKNILGYKLSDGTIARYDVKANDYVKGHPKREIFTMFKPDDKSVYFHNKKRDEGGTVK